MDKRLIYLDLCCFNRPYDDQSMLSIYLETQAKLQIQDNVRNNNIALVWSTMMDFENSANMDEIIREEINTWRELSDIVIHQSETIVQKAKLFQSIGLRNKDALHIASAIAGNARYFITTDKGILKKRDLIGDISVLNPVDFIIMMEEDNEN